MKTKPKPKPARKRARKPAAAPAPMLAVRRSVPRGMIWCGPCGAYAPEEGSEKTKHGFCFCAKHHSKAKS